MSAKEVPDQELKAIEDALRSLRPRPNSADRDQLMFLAGQASVAPLLSLSASVPQLPSLSGRGQGEGASRAPHTTSGARVASSSARRWLWPTASAAAALAAGIVGLAIGLHVERPITERIVEVRIPVKATDPATLVSHQPSTANRQIGIDSPLTWTTGQHRGASPSYVSLRDQVLALGPDCIPSLPRSNQNAPAAGNYFELRSGQRPSATVPSDQETQPELKKGSST